MGRHLSRTRPALALETQYQAFGGWIDQALARREVVEVKLGSHLVVRCLSCDPRFFIGGPSSHITPRPGDRVFSD